MKILKIELVSGIASMKILTMFDQTGGKIKRVDLKQRPENP